MILSTPSSSVPILSKNHWFAVTDCDRYKALLLLVTHSSSQMWSAGMPLNLKGRFQLTLPCPSVSVYLSTLVPSPSCFLSLSVCCLPPCMHPSINARSDKLFLLFPLPKCIEVLMWAHLHTYCSRHINWLTVCVCLCVCLHVWTLSLFTVKLEDVHSVPISCLM